MTNSPSAMPGAFNFRPREGSISQPAPPRLSGAKSHIFQPPRTPSASASSSLILTRSTTSVMSISSAGDVGRPKFSARKRTLEDYNEGSGATTPRRNMGGYAAEGHGYDWEAKNGGGIEDTAEGWIPGSPQPFVNTRYQLAGGMDTPHLAAAQEMENENFGDVAFRRSLGEDRPMKHQRQGLFGDNEAQSYLPMQEEFVREPSGRRSMGNGSCRESPRGSAWSKTAISVVGTVAGKVWEFCKNSSTIFSGFHAGGGTAYRLNPDEATPNFNVVEEPKNKWHEKNMFERESTPIPGQFPHELDFIPDYMDHPSPSNTPPRATKRRQTSYNNGPTDELAKNWVVVPPTTSTPTPSKAKPNLQRATAATRYSMPTSSSSARRANTSAHRPASRAAFASPARTFAAAPKLSRGVSHAGSPALNAGRGASFVSQRASPASSRIPRASGSPSRVLGTGMGIGQVESPAAKEAARWAAVKKREEREQDESLRRLDRQLKDLIREGKEALGTKVEVDIEEDADNRVGIKKWIF